MMRRKKIRICTVKKRFRVICAALCLLTVLTGCEASDKALVFSAESSEEGPVSGGQASRDASAQQSASGQASSSQGTLSQATDEASAAGQTVFVHVCGAVLRPGVVELPAGSRAKDALTAAGGFAEEADREYVNLATPVEDGQQLYFPTVEEAAVWREDMTVSRSGQIVAKSPGGLININTADVALLCTLPGIGEARARAIIAYREKQGGFEKPEDIMQVSGIKQSAYDKISEKIVAE